MKDSITNYYKADYSGKPMNELLKKNDEYTKSREKYHKLLKQVKQQLGSKGENNDLWLRLDEAVGDYSASYGDTAYMLGLHNGLELGKEHGEIVNMEEQERFVGINLEDMANLIHVLSAYKELNAFLFGAEMVFSFDEGILGRMGRIYKVINNHVNYELKKGEEDRVEKILNDTSLDPEEKARKLMVVK